MEDFINDTIKQFFFITPTTLIDYLQIIGRYDSISSFDFPWFQTLVWMVTSSLKENIQYPEAVF